MSRLVARAVGGIERWYGILTDIEDRKRAEAILRKVQSELAHANRIEALGQLAASIAHEVNQPITAAHMNANAALHFLDSRPPSLEEVREALHSVVREALRARDVINGLRALVKKTPPQVQSFDLNEAIREVILITHGEAQENNISVETQLADSLPFVAGDRVQLQQVILNLVVNAIEAMRSHGEGNKGLLICTRKTKPNDVLVEVLDSGPGVPPGTVEQLFEPFYTTKTSGLGLGLSICRSIVEAHNGRLWASQNKPRGAAFHFTVPVQPCAES
jgi:C4-dicarboxylate-specific signal transduction histidine kinase